MVVTTDAFRIGGRETFLQTYLSRIKDQYNVAPILMTRALSADAPSRIFDEVHVVKGEGAEEVNEWLRLAADIMDRYRSALIWAQHFGMLPAWLIATLHRQPLLATFHGPVDSIARPAYFQDCVGMALALHRLPFTTAVSEEVAESLISVSRSPRDVRILRNRVLLPTPLCSPGVHSSGRAIRMVMLTRDSKLGHIRAAVDFLGCWNRLEGRATLRIVTTAPQTAKAITGIDRLSISAKRLGRKWVVARFSRLQNLGNVIFAPAAPDPYREIWDCDVVLGMGRTVLEGIAMEKPTILIGYDRVIDLVTPENFQRLRRSNFSGRSDVSTPEDIIVRKTARCLRGGHRIHGSVIEEIDVTAHWNDAAKLLEAAAEIRPHPRDEDTARCLIEALSAAPRGGEVNDAVLSTLSDRERETVKRLGHFGA